MKSTLFLLMLASSSIALAQFQVNTLNVTTNDLVYDSLTNRIYVSIPSANGPNGNSIGVINPNTYALEQTIFIGSEPTVLAISDNGQYIYAGFGTSSTVRRFDIATRTAGIQFSLGSSSITGSYYVEDIEVMPGQPTTIAIARRNSGRSPRHEGVAIYDNNVMRSTTTPNHTGSNRIEFTSQNSLIGYNNETTEFGIRRLSVNNGGVSNVSIAQNVLSNFYLDFIYRDNFMYATDGKVVDVSTVPFVIGQFSNVYGPLVYDDYNNLVCFASYDFSGNITFVRFDPNTFLLYDSLPISQASGDVKNIVSCGKGCYAFNTTDDKLIIIKEQTSNSAEPIEKYKLSLYPNPFSDYLYLQSDLNINEVQISDLNGKAIPNLKFQENKMDLYSLQPGVYFARMRDKNGSILTKKIIKK